MLCSLPALLKECSDAVVFVFSIRASSLRLVHLSTRSPPKCTVTYRHCELMHSLILPTSPASSLSRFPSCLIVRTSLVTVCCQTPNTTTVLYSRSQLSPVSFIRQTFWDYLFLVDFIWHIESYHRYLHYCVCVCLSITLTCIY